MTDDILMGIPALPDADNTALTSQDTLHEFDVIRILRELAQVGMQASPRSSGPTILDINTGFMRDSKLRNIYRHSNGSRAQAFSPLHRHVYAAVHEAVRRRVCSVFDLNCSLLYNTAPTFLTRIVAHEDADFTPETPHDEYYHPHVDAENAPQYAYSALLYLSTRSAVRAGLDARPGAFAAAQLRSAANGCDSVVVEVSHDGEAHEVDAAVCADFAGGEFEFFDAANGTDRPLPQCDTVHTRACETGGERTSHVVAPRRGRLLIFSSGLENRHRVRLVTAGQRLVFSMWFTCDASHEFPMLLDGTAHTGFSSGKRRLLDEDGTDASTQ